MVALIVCIKRRPDFTVEAFRHYWRDVHAPLLLSCTDFARHVESYVQYHPVDGGSPVAAMFGVGGDYDGVAVLTFRDEAAIARAFAEPRYLELVRPDEYRFIDVDRCLPVVADAVVIQASGPMAAMR